MKRFLIVFSSLFLFLSFHTPFAFAQSTLPSTSPQGSGSDYTANSPCVAIPIGNSTVTATPPAGCQSGGSERPFIAHTIATHLSQGPNGYFNKINPNPFNYPGTAYLVKQRPPNPPQYDDCTDAIGCMFCTTMVIDTFSISGINIPGDLLNVNNQIAYWKSTPTLHYIDYWSAKQAGDVNQQKTLFQQVKPGDAIWFANTGYCNAPYCHTGIVYSIKINSQGDGEMDTREANIPTTINVTDPTTGQIVAVPGHKITISQWVIADPLTPDAGSFGGVN